MFFKPSTAFVFLEFQNNFQRRFTNTLNVRSLFLRVDIHVGFANFLKVFMAF